MLLFMLRKHSEYFYFAKSDSTLNVVKYLFDMDIFIFFSIYRNIN